MIECQIWPDSRDFAPVSAAFSVAPKVGETICVLVQGVARSFIVTGRFPGAVRGPARHSPIGQRSRTALIGTPVDVVNLARDPFPG
jgi:hypothetical protein